MGVYEVSLWTISSSVGSSYGSVCFGDATAVNQGETVGSLVIPVTGGQFTDSFVDKNAIHIYRIDGGSHCGLV